MPLPALINNFSRVLTTGLHFLSLFLVICFSGASMADLDDSFVEISGEMQNLSENEQVNETLYKTSAGKFSRIGSKKTLEGDLYEFSGCSEDPSKNESSHYVDDDTHSIPKLNWIAFLHIPATEYGTSHQTSCSIIDRIKKAMLFGASAILVFSVHKKIIKKLDVSQIFTHPVVVVSDTQVNKIRQEYKRGRKLYVKIADGNPTCKKYVQMYSTVTLWSTCFRPSEGSGVICPPSPISDHNTLNSMENIWTWTSFMAFILCACYLVKIKFQQWQEGLWMQHVEKSLQKLAREALSKMKTRTLTSSSCDKPTKGQSDVCAVCLDGFFSGQVVRVLHCRHEFHTTCVDPWLLIKRTCPLCKQDIIGDRALLCPTG